MRKRPGGIRFDEKVDVAGETGRTVECEGVAADDEVFNFVGVE